MKVLFLCSLAVLLFTSSLHSQNTRPFKKELTIKFDNDVLAARGTDRYYTNGLFVNFAWLAVPKKAGVIKKINSLEIGQKVYTPGRRNVYVVRELDRPITGYLYGQFSSAGFLKNNRMYKVGGSIGMVGPAALGKQLLDVFHPYLKINSDYWDWMFDYQLMSEVGVNVHGSYAFDAIKKHGLLQISPVTNATVGTLLTNITQAVNLRFGKQNGMSKSALWGSRIGEGTTPAKELFAYYQPEIMLQLYNATVQGGMFTKDKGKITSASKPVVISHTFGAMYAGGRCNLGFRLSYQGKEAKSQLDSHIFGGIDVIYRFR